jgi:release factor glutamine methyltransferase
MPRTYKDLYNIGKEYLLSAGIEEAENDAFLLLLFACGISRTQYLLIADQPVPDISADTFFSVIHRRCEREPLQYITGSQVFLGKTYYVGPGVLIPRPETEELTDTVISHIKQSGRKQIVFDLCAGSGCIGISIAIHCPETTVYLFEKYDAAINHLKKYVTSDVEDRVHIINSDVLCGPENNTIHADVIVSNPPYIKASDMKALQSEVLREPSTALYGGNDGLDFYKAISQKWLPFLNPGGFAAFECGEDQSEDVCSLFSPFGTARTENDFYGLPRFVLFNF